MNEWLKTIWPMAVFLAFPMAAVVAGQPEMSAKMRPDGQHGVQLFADGITISRGGRVSCIAPKWKEIFFKSIPYPGRPASIVERRDRGFVQRLPGVPGMTAELEEYSVECRGNRALITVQVNHLKRERAAVVEYCALVLNPRILEGGRYVLTAPGGERRSGVVPERRRGDAKVAFLPEFTALEISTPGGRLNIRILEGPPLEMEDRRASPFSCYADVFLVLTREADFPPEGGPFRQVIEVTFSNPEVVEHPPVSVSGVPSDGVVRKAGDGAGAGFPLLPVPHRMEKTGAGYQIAPGDSVVVSGGSERLMRHVGRFAAAHNIPALSGNSAPARGIFIIAGSDSGDESYTLTSGPGGVVISSGGERGAFYGLQTLRGLEKAGRVPGVKISDRPDFRLRAIHAQADSGAERHLREMIEKVMAPLKINTLILECPYVHWDTMAGQHHPRGMPKSRLVSLLETARENYLEVIPLIPTYSHSEWFFYNRKNREMLDSPRDTRSYNPLHPGVRPLLSRLFEEIIAAFGSPEYVHIGHDEVFGEHPVSPEARRAGLAKVFRDDILWHYEFFKSRGIKIMMWHDMLVSKAETAPGASANARDGVEKIRSGLPRDIVMCVWNYYDRMNGRYPEVDRFVEDGFPVVGASWFSAGNMEALSRKCRADGALGMMETTWHGKFGSEMLIHTQYRQLCAYVRAGALFWNVGTPSGSFDEAEVMVDLLDSGASEPELLYPLPLRANMLLTDYAAEFSGIAGDAIRSADGVVFSLLRHGRAPAAVSVKSLAYPELPEKVRIPVRRRCNRLYLLHTVLNRSPGDEGRTVKLVVRYRDGSFEALYPRNAIDIGYGDVPVFTDDGKPVNRIYEVGTPAAEYTRLLNHRNVFTWIDSSGERKNLWYAVWENPHPEKEVDHLLVESRNPRSVYALIGLTLAEDMAD